VGAVAISTTIFDRLVSKKTTQEKLRIHTRQRVAEVMINTVFDALLKCAGLTARVSNSVNEDTKEVVLQIPHRSPFSPIAFGAA
jgi:hypothetical protein